MGVSFKPVGVTERKLDRETETLSGMRSDETTNGRAEKESGPTGQRDPCPRGQPQPLAGAGPLTATRHRLMGAGRIRPTAPPARSSGLGEQGSRAGRARHKRHQSLSSFPWVHAARNPPMIGDSPHPRHAAIACSHMKDRYGLMLDSLGNDLSFCQDSGDEMF